MPGIFGAVQRHTGDGQPRPALRLGGLLMLGAGVVALPGNPFPAEPRGALQVIVLDAPAPAGARPAPALQPVASADSVPSPAPVARATPAFVVAPPPAPAPALVVIPEPARLAPVAPPPVPQADASVPTLRPVDVEQLTDFDANSLHVPQLNEPGLVAGVGGTLVAKVDAMQVPAVPSASEQERTALLAGAPKELTVRIGDDAVGTVAFRMSEASTIDVQLSGLLDLVASRMAPADYSRLRNSAAADTFVPLDALRAVGLSLRYDPVYDELDLSA